MGEFLALLSGVSYAGSNVFTRRGVFFSKETYSPLVISMCLGVLLFFLAVVISGSASSLTRVSWWGVLALSAAGIIHFVAGRSLNYTSLGLIGANRTVPLMSTNVLFATLLAVIFLREAVAPLHAVGTAAIFTGLVLIGTSSGGTPGTGNTARRDLFKGMAAGLGAGLCYGVSPLFVSIGVREVGSPFAGGLVSYLAAGVVTVTFLARPRYRRGLACLPRPALVSMLIGGSSVSAAQVFRYIALTVTPVNVVAPLTSTNNLFVPFLSWLVNRKMEVFSTRVLTGAASMITGVTIILLT